MFLNLRENYIYLKEVKGLYGSEEKALNDYYIDIKRSMILI